MTQSEMREMRAMIDALDERINAKIDAKFAQMSREILDASKFQDGAKQLAKGLAWVLGVLALLATIYGSVFK